MLFFFQSHFKTSPFYSNTANCTFPICLKNNSFNNFNLNRQEVEIALHAKTSKLFLLGRGGYLINNLLNVLHITLAL